MTFWDGTAWVPETPAKPARGGPNRAAAWVATLIMVASVGLYAVPFANTDAAGPTLTLSPASGAPGTKVVVTGKGFTSKVLVQLTWDGVSEAMPATSTNGRGGFRTSFKVPQTTTGPHFAGAQLVSTTTAATSSTTAATTTTADPAPATTADSNLATAEFHVTSVAEATPVPTVAPTAPPTAAPDPTAVPTPVATPVPTAVPTPAPTAVATPVPTAVPTPSLTITGVGSSAITQTTATIAWTVSAPATGQVEYGTTLAYGSFSPLENSFDYTTHIQQLSGLAAGTAYHYRTRSTDAGGKSAVSADYTFVTTAVVAPTPTPTATPTPAPTATPTPPPPPLSGRPFPAPTTAQTVSVPSSIDATGASDVSAALNAFVASVPDGSVIVFRAGGTYRLGAGIRFTNRHHLVFEGNGATLRPVGQTDSASNSAFALWGSNTDIIIRNFTIIGQNPNPGVYNWQTNENRYGVLVWGGGRVEIANLTMHNIWADYVGIGGQLPPSGSDMIESDNVWIHDSTMIGSGRMGISATATTHVLIERNTFDLTAWCTLDIEPNTSDHEVGWITFRNNVIKRGGTFVPEFVSANGGAGAWNVHDITITGNRTDQSLQTDIGHASRRRNVVFTNNIGAKPGGVTFAHIDGLTYHGNTNVTYSVSDSTNVDTTP